MVKLSQEYLGVLSWAVALRPSTGAIVAQSVKGSGFPLERVSFRVYDIIGSPTGDVIAEVYAHEGTFGSSGKPTGSPLKTSVSVDISSVSAGWVDFTFEGGFVLEDGTDYCLAINSVDSSDDDYIRVSGGLFDGSYPGNASYYNPNDSSWTSEESGDFFHRVYLRYPNPLPGNR